MIGWIQLREETLHGDLRRLARSDFVPSRSSRWELEKQIADKTEALRVANSHLLLYLADRMKAASALHGTPGQCWAAVSWNVDSSAPAVPELPEKAQKSLTEAKEICRSCGADIRTISHLLHPPLLDEAGLLPALEWFVTGFSER